MSAHEPDTPEQRLSDRQDEVSTQRASGETRTIPVIEETARIEKRAVETGRIRVRTETETRDQILRESLRSVSVAVTRVPVNRTLSEGEVPPAVREEDGVTIIPVLEEILVVEKRLVLKEEVHIRQTSADEDVEVPVTLRRQRAVVERVAPESHADEQIDPPFNPGDNIMTQTITALFDRPAEAQAAQAKLVAAGIPQSAIKLVQGAQTARTSGSYDYRKDEGGFWDSLKDFFMPEEDRYAYSEGLSRGGTLLTVQADQAQIETAYDILEQSGSVDLDQREASWRKEGWSGYSATGGATAATSGTTAAAGTTTGAAGAAAYASGERSATASVAGEKEYIPVVEERLNVGKRVAEAGRVRVRSYVVEKPVEEQVTLRDETVHVDRRTVDRAPTAADEALFESKTIEATEMREQAVVNKDARVVEEVGIHKDAGQRTETVTDKVRRTEVEVEDERGNLSRTGTTSGTTPRKPV